MHKSQSTAAFVCGVAILVFCSAAAEAQGRRAAPRPAGRHAAAPSARAVYLHGYGYRPYHYGFYDPFFYGPYAYPYEPYPYPYYGATYDRGSLRLQVKPKETEVYVDGSFAGTVDSYDGFFQRLHLPSGEHELELYLDGYESIRETLYLVSGQTYKISHEMVALAEGVPQPPRPKPLLPLEMGASPPLFDDRPSVAPALSERFGSVAIRVQPMDADVFVDGERWQGFEGLDRLVVELGAGAHVVEVRREGYREYRTEVEIREGDTTFLNVSLPRTEGDVR